MQHEQKIIKEMSYRQNLLHVQKLHKIWLELITCIFQQNHLSVGWKTQSKINKMKVQTTTKVIAILFYISQ